MAASTTRRIPAQSVNQPFTTKECESEIDVPEAETLPRPNESVIQAVTEPTMSNTPLTNRPAMPAVNVAAGR